MGIWCQQRRGTGKKETEKAQKQESGLEEKGYMPPEWSRNKDTKNLPRPTHSDDDRLIKC
jgi:hypothetical protein